MTSKPSVSSSSFIVEQMSSASSRIRIRLAIDVTAAFAFVRIAVVGDRQSHHEASAFPQFALNTDRTLVRFDDATSDEKPKPQSADIGRGAGTFESLEELGLLLRRDPGATILDHELCASSMASRVDVNGTLRREFDRIDNEIDEHLRDPPPVAT